MSLALESKSPRAVLTDRREYWLLFAATFVMFLVAAIVGRLFHSVLGGARSPEKRKSLFAEAKAAGYSSLAFAFMG